MKKMTIRRRNLSVFIIFLLALLYASCHFFKHTLLSENTRFKNFTEEFFLNEISSNTLNLHYTLAFPEKYGIKNYKISLGTMDPQALKNGSDSIKILQKKLLDFSPEKLSRDNQIIYDILRLELDTQSRLSDLSLLSEPLGPNLGIQAQLPILLAEYTFRTSADIKDYFSLLTTVPDFFQEIIKFEQTKSKNKLFMSDPSADRIIEQCRTLSTDTKKHYLYAMFTEKAEKLLHDKKISQKQYDSYIKMNQRLMKTSVFPAYKNLANALEALKGSGINPNGLAHLPNGKKYYENLIKSSVGDYRSLEEIEQRLKDQLLQDYNKLQVLQRKDPDLPLKALSIGHTSIHTPKQIVNYLNHTMTDQFPSLTVKTYHIKYVDESMKKFSSPAFYLTPPIDTLSPNTIYINPGGKISSAELFTTLAHEGFPGHMYQTLYFGNLHKNPIRELLGCSGYIEGWATYAESLSYSYGADFLGIEPAVMEFLSLNRSLNLCLYSILDIGIHGKGWTFDTALKLMQRFGITQENTCRDIFLYIVENPANYLKYYLGFLNFCDLKTEAEKALGADFDLKKFHQELLELGPAPFPVLKKYLLLP